MTIFQNIIQPVKTCNFSHNFQSDVLANIAVPATEPATAQASYTVTTGMLPTLTGDSPASVIYGGGILCGGVNNNAGALTLVWKAYKNGSLIKNGSASIPTGNKFCVNAFSFFGATPVIAGDFLELKLYCSENGTDLIAQRKGLMLTPLRFKPVNNANKLLLNSGFTTSQNTVPLGFTANLTYVANLQKAFTTNVETFSAGVYKIAGEFEHSTYGVWSNAVDPGCTGAVRTHATLYNVEPISIVTSATWQETNIVNGVNLK